MTTSTYQDQYNERYGNNIVDDLFKAMTTIQRLVTAITYIAMGTSFLHQANFLHQLGAQLIFAGLMPFSLDVLMVVLMKVASLKGIPARSRWIARALLTLPAGASAYINYAAGGPAILRGMFVFVVAAIVIGEVAQGLIKPNFAALEKAATAAAAVPAAQVEDEARRAKRREQDRVRRANQRAKTNADAAKRAAKAEAARVRRAANREVLGDLVDDVESAFAAEPATATA